MAGGGLHIGVATPGLTTEEEAIKKLLEEIGGMDNARPTGRINDQIMGVSHF